MVVVVIIGILVAIAVPVYNNAQTSAKANACKSNIRIINGAIEMAVSNGVTRTSIDNAALSGYVKSWPTCPVNSATAYTVTAGVLNETAHFAAATPNTHTP